ncbi:glycerophosphodiester phosphodiesterase family protein [Bifidobacterium xylocopae]|uniref:Glycerophosphodiester phosphodiesterase n=1 Tax=Bifidobacterium xylocopae TaxID=2493119 RepID=A0A366KE92_9BIFI|nr:glycerophosphodiester phosphodiesterase family protein [Bifidobacterium xylocopae]RBP99433.1 glycerophosphodiester phosphodiesterase [Bifidobacterium xylocopae]
MGSIRRVAKVGEALIGAGLAAGAAGVWALAPRGDSLRRLQCASEMPVAHYAHRGLHDAGSGIESDRTRAGADERAYVEAARRAARNEDGHRHAGAHAAGGHSGVWPEAITQQVAAVGSGPSDISVAPENSLPAFAAACRLGYGIELDVRLSRDRQVVVVHDDDLNRVAADGRKVADLTYEELCRIPIASGPGEGGSVEAGGGRGRHAKRSEVIHVPLLADVLELVAGRVPLIVEYKMGRELDRELMERADVLLAAYEGPYVIESFNPLALAWYRRHRPSVLRGQLAAPYHGRVRSGSDLLEAAAGALLLNWLGRPDFMAYEWHGGRSLPMRLFRALGGTPVAWTVRSRQAEREAASSFDLCIFESYLPAVTY